MRTGLVIPIIALALIALLAARPYAQGKHITEIAEKHALIEKRRPEKKAVAGAQKIVDKFDKQRLPIVNAMRLIARGDTRLREDPLIHGRLDVPPLGVLEGDAACQPDTWILLRIAALLRNGYPAEPNLMNEIGHWFDSAAPLAGNEWADASLELLALDALIHRQDAMLKPLQARAIERAKKIVERRDWGRHALAEPGLREIAEHLNFALARRLALRNGWGECAGADDLAAIVTELARCLKACKPDKPLWLDIPKEHDAEYYRALLVIGALLSMVETDETMPRAATGDAGKALKDVTARLPELYKSDDWRCFEGDALALTLTLGESIGRAAQRVLETETRKRALNPGRFDFGLPMPKNGHVAPQLRWVLCRSLGDKGMGRSVLDVEDRDRLSNLCMALVACSGGLLGLPSEPLDWGDAESIFRALETLDLDDYYGYMVKTDLAIDSAAKWMLDKQQSDGLFFGGYRAVLGGHALAVHALLDAGVSRDDKRVKKAFDEMVKMIEGAIKDTQFGAFGSQNYSCSIALMTFQSWYEPEIRQSGMYDARTCEAYEAARARLWPKISKQHQDLIANISWRLSNADGYGWSYSLPEEKRPQPSPATSEPRPRSGKADPITGNEPKEHPAEIDDERARRAREGKYPPRPDKPANGARHGDNSNSQYSVLGLKAGMTLGAPIDFGTLAWEAQRLVEGFVVHGWDERLIDPTILLTLDQLEKRRDARYAEEDPNAYRLRPKLEAYQIGGWSYFCNGVNTWGATDNEEVGKDDKGEPIYRWPISVAMTAAGISSLAIIRDALMVAPIYDPELIAKVDNRLAGGNYGLGMKYPYSRQYFKVEATQTECWIGGGEGSGMLYDMYACERAGVLTGKVYFGTAEWYRDGADVIMNEQQPNGGWKNLEQAVCNASWTILFLKRSAPWLATQRPPRDAGPVTGK
jgi:hypothetical protein